MSTVPAEPTPEIVYPETDGLPMAESTRQFEWIVVVKLGLDAVYRDRADVFVAGDLFWYPVEGHPEIRTAPDTLVAFGRPKGHRGSYRQWEEGGVAPQVVFEILSPGNTPPEMDRKFAFYYRHGVEEYYVYDPEAWELDGWVRRGGDLVKIARPHNWVSPRLGIRFDLSEIDLIIHRPDGERFRTYPEWVDTEGEAVRRIAEVHAETERERDRADREAGRADREARRAKEAEQLLDLERQLAEQHRAELEKYRAESEKQRAEFEKQRAEWEKQRAEREEQRAAALQARTKRLLAQMKAAGLEPANGAADETTP